MSENTFCTSLPHQPRIWDASRIRIAKTCLRKHWLQTVRGLRRVGGSNVHQEWGTDYHTCVEHFDRGLLDGGDRETLTLEAIDLAFTLSWDPESKQPRWGEWLETFQCTDPEFRPHKHHPERLVLNRERCEWAKHPNLEQPLGNGGRTCICGKPFVSNYTWRNEHAKKTRRTLLMAVALYCDTTHGVTPYRFPNGLPAVEVQARVPLPLNSPDTRSGAEGEDIEPGVPYELLVNIDSLVDWEGLPAIRERKTTGRTLDARYWRQFELDPQIDTYDLVGSVLYHTDSRPPKIMVEALRVGAKDAELQRQPFQITEERRAEWLGEIKEIVSQTEIAAYKARRIGVEMAYPRNSTACHGAYGTCPYFAICSASPSEREAIIAADYVIERWDPLRAERVSEESE